MNEPILATKQITKSFSGVKVLKGVDFTVSSGEIMGLIGENGAGKSTLMKIIAGLYTFDSGEIIYKGSPITYSELGKARNIGISIIHQEFNLFANLSVAENIFLDRKDFRSAAGRVNWTKMNREAKRVLGELGAGFDVTLPVRLLSVREQQLVEIAKAISTDAKVLIMDEPSAALPDNEVQNMFEVVRMLKNKGVAVVYISHRMKEIEQICDKVTVLRDGLSVGVLEMAASPIDHAISLMVGREIKDYYPHTAREAGQEMLRVDSVSGGGLKNVSLTVRKNEVVGLYGLAGAGATELAEIIMGLRNTAAGSVFVGGKAVKKNSIAGSINAGIGYVPPDRRQEGVVVNLPIAENIILANLPHYSKGGLLEAKKIDNSAKKHIAELKLKCTGAKQTVVSLSGGNQQKVVLSKWLDRSPGVLILNEPTRGVDVGAKSEIYRLIDQLSNSGLAILLISSELPEILGISDRVLVMCRGRITGEYPNEGLGQDVLLKAASGTEGGGGNE